MFNLLLSSITVAKMFARVHGLQRLSIGEAIRSLLSNQKQRELTIQIKKYLTQGLAVPDELAVQCLDLALMDLVCQSRGYAYSFYNYKYSLFGCTVHVFVCSLNVFCYQCMDFFPP